MRTRIRAIEDALASRNEEPRAIVARRNGVDDIGVELWRDFLPIGAVCGRTTEQTLFAAGIEAARSARGDGMDSCVEREIQECLSSHRLPRVSRWPVCI